MTEPSDLPTVNVRIVNALHVGSPLAEPEIEALIRHFAALHPLLRQSGPQFAHAVRECARLHNRAVGRLRETIEQRRQREIEEQADVGYRLIEDT